MAKWKKAAHVVYQCSYHIVWTPKYRFQILEGVVARLIEHKIRAICEWKQAEILELNIRKDHVHMIVTIPPRLAISEMMGILKGKTAIAVFKQMQVLKKNLLNLILKSLFKSRQLRITKVILKPMIILITVGGNYLPLIF